MKHSFSNRVSKVEELIFRRLDSYRKKNDLIDLSKGLPVGMPPREVLYELALRLNHAQNHVYNVEKGLKELRDEVAYFYKDKFDVDLDPETEVQILIGSKEGIAGLALACASPGDRILVPDPSFPAFTNAIHFANAEPVPVPLSSENNYIPTRSQMDSLLNGKEKLMYINYPHSPTGAVCTIDDFRMFSDFAKDNNIVLCYDAAYRELSFKKHPTLLQVEGAKDCCVEIASFSKTFDMCGWRIAYMVGNKDVIAQVRKTKSVFDVGQFVPIQYAACLALKMVSYMDDVASKYREKAEIGYKLLKELGYDVYKPGGGYFLWVKLPKPFISAEQFMEYNWKHNNVLMMPGSGFGMHGEGHFRVSLTNSIEDITKGINALGLATNFCGVSLDENRCS